MTADRPPPVLTDPVGMGGIIAQDGFNYQLWDGLARLPAWLTNPAFEAMIYEGLEDLEAKFFAPQAPEHQLLERFQAKSGNLPPAGVRDVLSNFQDFEKAYPRVARVQTLVTPRLPPTLSWLSRDPERVRRARPFYAPFAAITDASDAQLKQDLVKEFGTALGTFVAQSVEFSERSYVDETAARHAFADALHLAFPGLDLGAARAARAFEALCTLARGRIGVPLARSEVQAIIETSIGQALPLPKVLPLHIRSDRNERVETALELDASAYSGGNAPFPAAYKWQAGLVEPLDAIQKWLRAHSYSRVHLSGSYRLSTGMAVGWALRSALGVDLQIETRSGVWSTDDRAGAVEEPAWTVTSPSASHEGRLLITIGVIRDPVAQVVEAMNVPADKILALHHAGPLTSGKEAQAGASAVKRAVDAAIAQYRPKVVDVFIASPAAFAVAVGHRWNAMPPTQLHEYVSNTRQYVPTVLLE
jgi:hypothetical protein